MRITAVADSISEDTTEEISLILKRKLGEGTHGVIHEAELTKTGEMVAIKICNIGRYGETGEVEGLKTLRHCNIVKMLYHFQTSHPRKLNHIVMERMPGTLWDFCYHKYRAVDSNIPITLFKMLNRGCKVSKFDTKLYMYQLLRSLAYMHANNICHRDVKPTNILLDPRTGVLKLCDFGSARDLSLSESNSTNVCTINYRAPEHLLGYTNYTNSIDVWSAGCILVELLKGGRMLFADSSYPFKQLTVVMELIGTPTQSQFTGMKPRYPIEELIEKEAKPWSEILKPCFVSNEAISLCSNLFCYSPSSRLLPHEALAHKFFDELRSPERKLLGNGNRLPPLFNFQAGEFPGGFDHLIPSYIRK